MQENENKIQVCDHCFQASCWQALFMCWKSQHCGTVHLTKEALRKKQTGENEDYWKTDEELASED